MGASKGWVFLSLETRARRGSFFGNGLRQKDSLLTQLLVSFGSRRIAVTPSLLQSLASVVDYVCVTHAGPCRSPSMRATRTRFRSS